MSENNDATNNAHQEFESIIEEAENIADHYNHDYITIEHVLYGVLSQDICKEFIDNYYNVTCDDLISILDTFLSNIQMPPISKMNDSGFSKIRPDDDRVLTRHCYSLIESTKENFAKLLHELTGIAPVELNDNENVAVSFAISMLYTISTIDKKYHFAPKLLHDHGITVDSVYTNIFEQVEENQEDDLINKYTVNLNEQAKNDNIDPVIGRENQIESIIDTTLKRKKSNIILVGEPGVGKTAIVEGLAKLIVDGKAPEPFSDKEIYNVNISSLLAGCKLRGDFEERLKIVINYFTKYPDKYIFIDEIHLLLGAGSHSTSSMDAANIIKPELASGQIKVIGATTYDEYLMIVNQDKAFKRRFAKCDVPESTMEETKIILNNVKSRYEEHHGVKISDEQIDDVISLTNRYVHQEFFPDKAFDLMDLAMSKAKVRNRKYVEYDDILNALVQSSNIDAKLVDRSESNTYLNIADYIKSRVIGQNEAIDAISDTIIVAKTGMRDASLPIGSYLFAGPTGTGKTLTVEVLAEKLSIPLLKYDMSEYMEQHTASKFIGSPPGYVGHGEGRKGDGQLVSDVIQNPHSVILVDEIEKAHEDIYNIFLQVLDKGTLKGSSGSIANFSNCIIIFTSNAGIHLSNDKSVGFVQQDKRTTSIMEAIRKDFSPEFRNRLDEVIVFNNLSKEDTLKIVDLEITKVNTLLDEKNIKICLSDEAKSAIVDLGFSKEYGARYIKRVIHEQLKKPISKKLLKNSLSNKIICVDYKDNDFYFNVKDYDDIYINSINRNNENGDSTTLNHTKTYCGD